MNDALRAQEKWRARLSAGAPDLLYVVESREVAFDLWRTVTRESFSFVFGQCMHEQEFWDKLAARASTRVAGMGPLRLMIRSVLRSDPVMARELLGDLAEGELAPGVVHELAERVTDHLAGKPQGQESGTMRGLSRALEQMLSEHDVQLRPGFFDNIKPGALGELFWQEFPSVRHVVWEHAGALSQKAEALGRVLPFEFVAVDVGGCPTTSRPVQLLACRNLHDEVRSLASVIGLEVRTRGTEPADICVAFPSPTKYAAVVRDVFADYSLTPLMFNIHPVLSSSAWHYLGALRAAVEHGVSISTLRMLVKSPLFARAASAPSAMPDTTVLDRVRRDVGREVKGEQLRGALEEMIATMRHIATIGTKPS